MCFKNQKYPSFSLSGVHYLSQSASGYPVGGQTSLRIKLQFGYILNILSFKAISKHSRLYGGPKSHAPTIHLLTNPIYTKVIENNVHINKSFGSTKMNIEKVLKEPKAALFLRHSYLSNLEEYECKVNKDKLHN